ncbi:unnamed protein product [Rhodiola kirilowii]
MARKKVQLAWIENQTARKATLRKRRENLIKKVKEISVLAGTDCCGIILSPFEGDPPLFYPLTINEIVGRYFELPEIDQFKRMVSIESYMKDEITKLKETLQKERRNVREVEVSYTMNSIHTHGRSIETMSSDETSELFWYFEQVKKKCELRMNSLEDDPNNNNNEPPEPAAVVVVQMAGNNNENFIITDDHHHHPYYTNPTSDNGLLFPAANSAYNNNINNNGMGMGMMAGTGSILDPSSSGNHQPPFGSYQSRFFID